MKLSFIKKSILAAIFATSVFAYADTATVISVTGKVEVNRKDAWVPVTKDTVIREGEVISTGFKSEALVKYKDSVMKLGPLTRITLEKLASSDSKENVSVYLSTGTVRSSVSHSENKRVSYTVRNPIAVASVRGTEFEMDGLANVDCFDGGVFVVPAENVDPRRDLGINSPAGAKAASDGDEGKAPEPKDGETNAFTSGSDINPNLRGGVLITGGQSTDFKDPASSKPSRAKTGAEANLAALTSDLNTASDREYTPTVDSNSGSSVSGATSQTKGKLVIKLLFN